MLSRRRLLKGVIFFLCALIVSCSKDPSFNVQKSTHYNILFNKNIGWTGADGAYSVLLPDNKILWLYGDTWIGKIHNNKHVDSTLINNSVAIQQGKNPINASVRFFFRKTSEGKPDAFIKPVDKKGWFWIYHGVMTKNGLYLFLMQINRSGDQSLPGFKIIGTWLGHVLYPNQPPNKWKIDQHKIPWGKYNSSGDTIFGSFVLLRNGFAYIYGTSEDIKDGVHHKFMILARAPMDTFAIFNTWRFYANGNWVDNFSLASRICEDIANEYSVSYLPVFDKYIAVYTENSVSENIVIRLAPEPVGPWSDPATIYKCPEAKWDKSIYCYAAKAHPALTSAQDELIISYVANSTDFWKMASDARLYRPRFLKVRFKLSK